MLHEYGLLFLTLNIDTSIKVSIWLIPAVRERSNQRLSKSTCSFIVCSARSLKTIYRKRYVTIPVLSKQLRNIHLFVIFFYLCCESPFLCPLPPSEIRMFLKLRLETLERTISILHDHFHAIFDLKLRVKETVSRSTLNTLNTLVERDHSRRVVATGQKGQRIKESCAPLPPEAWNSGNSPLKILQICESLSLSREMLVIHLEEPRSSGAAGKVQRWAICFPSLADPFRSMECTVAAPRVRRPCPGPPYSSRCPGPRGRPLKIRTASPRRPCSRPSSANGYRRLWLALSGISCYGNDIYYGGSWSNNLISKWHGCSSNIAVGLLGDWVSDTIRTTCNYFVIDWQDVVAKCLVVTFQNLCRDKLRIWSMFTKGI